MSALKLAIFDYDGTLTLNGDTNVAPGVFPGIQNLWSKTIATSVITARPYQRLVTISGGIDRLVSPYTPLATDRGARIVDGRKDDNLYYDPLQVDELRSIIDMPKDEIDFIGFYPEELYGVSYIWTPDEERRRSMATSFRDAVVLKSDIGELGVTLARSKPCLVTIKFREERQSNRKLFPGSLNTAWDGKTVSVITNGVNKRTAFKLLSEASNVPSHSILYGGNDETDLPVLSIPTLFGRIFVGDDLIGHILDPATHIASADILGEYLLSL